MKKEERGFVMEKITDIFRKEGIQVRKRTFTITFLMCFFSMIFMYCCSETAYAESGGIDLTSKSGTITIDGNATIEGYNSNININIMPNVTVTLKVGSCKEMTVGEGARLVFQGTFVCQKLTMDKPGEISIGKDGTFAPKNLVINSDLDFRVKKGGSQSIGDYTKIEANGSIYTFNITGEEKGGFYKELKLKGDEVHVVSEQIDIKNKSNNIKDLKITNAVIVADDKLKISGHLTIGKNAYCSIWDKNKKYPADETIEAKEISIKGGTFSTYKMITNGGNVNFSDEEGDIVLYRESFLINSNGGKITIEDKENSYKIEQSFAATMYLEGGLVTIKGIDLDSGEFHVRDNSDIILSNIINASQIKTDDGNITLKSGYNRCWRLNAVEGKIKVESNTILESGGPNAKELEIGNDAIVFIKSSSWSATQAPLSSKSKSIGINWTDDKDAIHEKITELGYNPSEEPYKYVLQAYFDTPAPPISRASYGGENGTELFLHGKFIELGISNWGDFGTLGTKPGSFRGTNSGWNGSARVGMSADHDGFNFGVDKPIDYYLPGCPEERFVVGYKDEVGKAFTNTNSAQMGDRNMVTKVTNLSRPRDSVLMAKVVSNWENKMEITQLISFGEADKFYKNEVTIKNISDKTMNDVRYMRNFDPDNTQFRGGTFSTQNDILYQNADGSGGDEKWAVVRAQTYSPTDPLLHAFDKDDEGNIIGETKAPIFFFSEEANTVVANFGFSNRDPYYLTAYDQPQAKGHTTQSDSGISITHAFGTLTTDEVSEKFVYFTSLDNRVYSSVIPDIKNAPELKEPKGNGTMYTVTFQSSNGDEIESKTMEGGLPVSFIEAPLVEGKIFELWEVQGSDESNISNLQENIILKAVYIEPSAKLKIYTITYDPNGGTFPVSGGKAFSGKMTVMDDTDVSIPVVAPEPTTPIKSDGSVFSKWTTDKEGNTPWNFTTDTVTNDLTLYANWEVPATVTFQKNCDTPDTDVKIPDTRKVPSNEKIVLQGASRKGYRFEKWTEDKEGTVIPSITDGKYTVENDVTLYAQWTKIPLEGTLIIYKGSKELSVAPVYGDELTSNVYGVNSLDTLCYQWYRVKDDTETVIEGATNKKYTVTEEDVDYKLVLKVTTKEQSGEISVKTDVVTRKKANGKDYGLHVVYGYEKDYSVDLSTLLPELTSDELGEIVYSISENIVDTDSILSTVPTKGNVMNSKLKVSIANVAQANIGKTVTIKIGFKSSKNQYEIKDATITVTVVDKVQVSVEANMPNHEYNGEAYAYLEEPVFKVDGKAVNEISYKVMYESRDKKTYPKSEKPPKAIGEYNLIIMISGDSLKSYKEKTNPEKIEFSITKITPTSAPVYTGTFGENLGQFRTEDDFAKHKDHKIAGTWEITTENKETIYPKKGEGEYEATFTPVNKEQYNVYKIKVRPIVAPREITDNAEITIDAIADQVYTGGEIQPSITINDTHTNVDITEDDYKAVYKNNKVPGEAILTITGRGNYAGTKSVKFNILKGTSVITVKDVTKVYQDKFALHATNNVKAPMLYESSNTDIATVDKDGNVEIVGVGTAEITISVKETDNYTSTSTKATVVAGKKQIKSINSDFYVLMNQANDVTFELSKLLSKGLVGSITQRVSSVSANGVIKGSPTIQEGILAFAVGDVKEEKMETIEIAFDSPLYDITNASLNIRVTDKIPVTFTSVGATNKVYNGKPYIYEGNPIIKNVTTDKILDVNYKIEYEGTDYAKSLVAPTHAGKYNLILTVTDEQFIGQKTVEFHILPKDLTVQIMDKHITIGNQVPSLHQPKENKDYKIVGLVGKETLNDGISGKLLLYYDTETQPSNKKVGKYPIMPSGISAKNNYKLKIVNGNLYVKKQVSNSFVSGGGSSKKPTNGGKKGTEVIVDGKKETIGEKKDEVTKKEKKTTIIVDKEKLKEKLANSHDKSEVKVLIGNDEKSAKDDKAVVKSAEFVVKNIEEMAEKEITLVVETEDINYIMRATAVDTNQIKKVMGEDIPTSEIPFNVTITKPTADEKQKVMDTADEKNLEVIGEPVEFEVTASHKGKTFEINRFKLYVARMLEVTADEAGTITTAIVHEEDGSVRHVPTEVVKIENTYYAKVNSLTNSVYTLIHNEQSFDDTKGKWYESIANEMASRKIINGRSDKVFDGDANITRAEFAKMIVSALGLPTNGNSKFTDVPKEAWYAGYVGMASEYNLIHGVGNGLYEPMRNITRQEVMAIIERASHIAEFDRVEGVAEGFSDIELVSSWAKSAVDFSVTNGMIIGNNGVLRPQDTMTRAESAAVILRFLRNADLINKKQP